jgi:hypothetical protein
MEPLVLQTIVSHVPYYGTELRVVRADRPPRRIVAQDGPRSVTRP